MNVGPTIEIDTDAEQYLPGDFLTCEYRVKLGENPVQAMETSIIWITEGKGEEDIGVHFFERRQGTAINADTFNLPLRLSTVLPASPLSYEGEILKIRWNVRVRLFLEDGHQVTEDEFFRLGNVQSFDELVKEDEAESTDGDPEESAA